MKYYQEIILKNGKTAVLRNGTETDGSAVLENFNATHAETDYLLSYPDETTFDAIQEGRFLSRKEANPNEVEIIAIVDGKVAADRVFKGIEVWCHIRSNICSANAKI